MHNEQQAFKDFYNQLKPSIKECFHKDKHCSPEIIKSHSIQNNRTLKKISNCGEVVGFTFILDETSPLFEDQISHKKIGKKTASTFTGFCRHHDLEIFKPIEEKDYALNNQEQEFLFAYRAAAYEYWNKKFSLELLNNAIAWLKKDNAPIPVYISDLFEGVISGYKWTSKLRVFFNVSLNKQNYWKIQTTAIIFNNEHPLAASAAITPIHDFAGNKVNKLMPKSRFLPLLVNVFPQNGKTYVLLGYRHRDKSIFEYLKTQLLNINENQQKKLISNLIVSNVSNLYFSPNLWQKYGSDMQNRLNKYFADTIYKEPDRFYQEDINLFV